VHGPRLARRGAFQTISTGAIPTGVVNGDGGVGLLIEIGCPHCEHRGVIAADRVPGFIYCSACGRGDRNDAGVPVRSLLSHVLNVIDRSEASKRARIVKRKLVPRVA
jgi:hypothetical protein